MTSDDEYRRTSNRLTLMGCAAGLLVALTPMLWLVLLFVLIALGFDFDRWMRGARLDAGRG